MRRVLVVVFVLVGSLLAVPAGVTQTNSPGLLLIMDASGSMNRDAGNGDTLLDEAKDALREIVSHLPPGTNVGLRVYGHRTPNDDAAVGCVDTELVVPVGPVDEAAMYEAIGAFEASGFTPIGLSLQEAVSDLGDAGGTIILVSDGVDTCAPPDPCEVAQQLAQDGYIAHIHTVGLLLQDQNAVDQLQCIADVGNGTFSGVDTTEQILERLSGVVTDVVEDPGFARNVIGGLTRQLAPVLQWDVPGDGEAPEAWLTAWVQGSIRGGETRWFAVDVDRDGYHLAANVTLDWPWTAETDEYLEVQIFDEAGEPVGEPHVVAGIPVEWPQRLHLNESADWLPALINWFPAATAVTDSASMFPSWEPDEEFFGPTVTRFQEAGYNGGIYHLWKRWNPGPPLDQGRYYVAMTWESDRNLVVESSTSVTMYPTDREVDPWRDRRPRPPIVILPGGGADEVVEAEPWTGGRLSGPFETPLRAIEVWSAIEVGEARRFSIDLAEGEWLVIGWDLELMRWVDGWNPQDSMQISLLDATESVPETFMPERDGPILGYSGTSFFLAPRSGLFTVEATLTSVGGGREPAVALSLLVLPDVAEGLLIPDAALRAMLNGLHSVEQQAENQD